MYAVSTSSQAIISLNEIFSELFLCLKIFVNAFLHYHKPLGVRRTFITDKSRLWEVAKLIAKTTN